MNELTRLQVNQLERAARLSQARITKANPDVLGISNGVYRAQTESIGNTVTVITDGEEPEYFGAGMVVGSAPIKVTR